MLAYRNLEKINPTYYFAQKTQGSVNKYWKYITVNWWSLYVLKHI